MKLLQCSRTRLRNRCKRDDVGRIAARVSSERSEVAMLGLESMPYRICEETLGQVVHLFKTYTTSLTQCLEAGLPYLCWTRKGGVAAAHFDKCPKIVPETLDWERDLLGGLLCNDFVCG